MTYKVRATAELATRLASEEGNRVVRGINPYRHIDRFNANNTPYMTREYTITGQPDVPNWRRFGQNVSIVD